MTIKNNTQLKDRIIGMLTENTGINMLDSGGVNGRGWQRNQLIKDWDKVPVMDVDVCSDTEVIVSYSTYHLLINFLEITDKSESLNAALKEFMTESDNPYPEDVTNFILNTLDTEQSGTYNTYNYENIISNVLQYNIFEVVDDGFYIALQIHNGADVRGGYTVPQIFSLGSDDNAAYFGMAQTDLTATCDCSTWISDDAGCNYYPDSNPSDPIDWTHDTKNNRITCNKCGKEVVFSVMESW